MDETTEENRGSTYEIETKTEGQLISRSRKIPNQSIEAFLQSQPSPKGVWHPPDGPMIAFSGAVATIHSHGPDRFQKARKCALQAFAERDVPSNSVVHPRFFGGAAFRTTIPTDRWWDGFQSTQFWLPQTRITKTENGCWLTMNDFITNSSSKSLRGSLAAIQSEIDSFIIENPSNESCLSHLLSYERSSTRSEWRERVETAISIIHHEPLQKVVLAQTLDVDFSHFLSAAFLFQQLVHSHDRCHKFIFSPDETSTLFGATPERLASVNGQTMRTEALAGSIKRGETNVEDQTLAERLRDSKKNSHEHELVVKAISDQLAGNVSSIQTKPRQIRRLSSVQHLHTPIEAQCSKQRHILSLVDKLHPTPAVGGLPSGLARKVICDIEPFGRGWYAGPIGWFDAAGDGEFVVGIRSGLSYDKKVRLYAGAGIVSGSDPDREWDEIQLKFQPLLHVLQQ